MNTPKMFDKIKGFLSKRGNRGLQMFAMALPLLFVSLFTVGGEQWLLDIITHGGMAVFASSLFYMIYRATAYDRIHQIAKDNEERGDRYRIAMLFCYAIIFAACFV